MDASSTTLRPVPTLVLLLSITYIVSLVRWRVRSHGRPLPPGPKALPFVGNLAHMSKSKLWKANRELCDEYGDIVYVSVLGQGIVLLRTLEVIHDLLDTRSAVTSDRQQSVLVPLTGQDFNIAFMAYTPWWRRHRRAFQQYFFPIVNPDHLQAQRRAASMFIRKLLADPGNLCEHIRYTSSASIIEVMYGIQVEEKHDVHIALMEKVLEGLAAFSPGRFVVQYLPGASHLPEWLPGVGSQLRQLAASRAAAREATEGMFEKTKNAVERGDAPRSVLADLLEKAEGKEGIDLLEKWTIAKNVAITAFEGGADTTFSTLQVFFLAMSLHPEEQKKAQAELDAVVGPHRLPEPSDRASLPYVNAVIKETLRWQTVGPFGVPHYSTEDMEYRGYFIPKGTILSPQAWACMHDPAVYPEPHRFMPERFLRSDGQLNPDVPDPGDCVFGFGRRVCPGRYFAEAAQFINQAMVLHVFDISPPLDELGKPILIEPRLEGTFLSYPVDMRCTIRARNVAAEQLALSTYSNGSQP